MSTASMWSPISGPGSEATVIEVFSAWLADQGWECKQLPSHGDRPAVDARHPDGRRLIVEAKGFSRDSGSDLDTGYGKLLRRITDEPDTVYALVVAKTVVRFAQRVPSGVRDKLGIALYAVDASGKVDLVDGPSL